jgi:SAM-dependent methyltransferase
MRRNTGALPSESDTYLYHTRPEIIARYVSPTVAYVVKSVYGQIYKRIIQTLTRRRPTGYPFRILEYGCGPGMNLLEVIELFLAQGAHPVNAIGTDFSPPMIEAARCEAKKRLGTELNIVSYFVARNEALTHDLASLLGVQPSDLQNTFDLILGVNTFRYAYRLNKANTCAREIFSLLRPGGYSVMIDMNRGFRFVGSNMHDIFTRAKQKDYIPSLQQYSRPFYYAGFVIEESRTFFCFTSDHFCAWLPCSARSLLVSLCRDLIPFWNTCFSPLARHSLVIGNKPVHEKPVNSARSLPHRRGAERSARR